MRVLSPALDLGHVLCYTIGMSTNIYPEPIFFEDLFDEEQGEVIQHVENILDIMGLPSFEVSMRVIAFLDYLVTVSSE